MKLIGNILLLMIVAVAVKFLYAKFGGGGEKEAELPPGVVVGSREHLVQVAAEINQTLPKKLDSEVTITRVVGRERQLIYQADLASIAGRTTDSAKFVAAVTPGIRKAACGEKRMKLFWKHDITATYRFIGNDQFALGEVSVSKADCG